MYEKIKIYFTENTSYLRIACYIALLVVVFLLGRATAHINTGSTNTEIQSSINAATTAGSAVSNAGEQIKDAQSQLASASETVDRVSSRIDDSKKQAEQISATVDECTRIVKDCRDLNQRAKKLLEEARVSN